MRLRRLGVKLRFIPDRGGRFELEDLRALLTPRTRLISLSLVNFVTGFRAPIEEIGALCRERGIWLVVDAVQALGAIRVHARDLGADILAAHGYKHLLSGYGVALCYCSPRARQELDITIPAWPGTMANADPSAMLDYEGAVFTGDARRFEPAVPNFAGSSAPMRASALAGCGAGGDRAANLRISRRSAAGDRGAGLSGREPAPPGRALEPADLRLPAGDRQRRLGEKSQ
jgi:Selenocysteine lyase